MNNLFNKTGMLFLLSLRRDWLKLLIWAIALSLFAGGFATALYEMYGKDPAGLIAMYETMKNPVMIAMLGPTAATAETYTIGAMYAHEMILFTALVFAIVSIMHVISRTRKEEDDGISELIRSFQVGRLAKTTAIVLEMLLLHVVIIALSTVLLQVQDIPGLNFSGNLLYSISLGVQGFLWAMIALIFVQIATGAGGARGLSFLTLGLFYIIRMATDMSAPDASWFNPLGWSYLVNVYVSDDWLPIVIAVVASIVCLVFSYILEHARDMGGGYLPERSGRDHAKERLLSLHGLILRLQKTFIISWLISIFIIGAMYGSIFEEMDEFVSDSEMMKQMFLHNANYTIQEQFMSVLFVVLSLLTTVFIVGSLMKLINEEKKGHWDQLYATKLSRAKFYWCHVILTFILGVLGQFSAILGLYLSQRSVMETPLSLWEITKAGIVWVPAEFFFIGILAILIGWLPRWTAIIWGYLVFSFFVSYFGQMMDIPEFIINLDIFSYIPKVPIEEWKWGTIILIKLLALFMIVIGFIGYKKRDLVHE
ncbi:ABC transporter permease [Robertmurraya andreesenii]|uniref:ABC-2 type transport system permease protein n=1 Tax=Anoxybacillus andreesenii TaxID=1325932 RepID=A0ABT9V176_9BACL|nr:tetronasin resistance protein [Robertmurraya andreesenii]MDQ0154704.1 ABC-2 type transport system permease protein [Robertmurraya andreesenii]